MKGELVVLVVITFSGLGLLVAGDGLRRRSQRVAQILAGLGIVLLFFSTWGATEVLGIVPWSVGLGLVFSITLLAGVLSVRHGYLLAILGVVLGIAMPIWILPDDPPAFAPVGSMALVLFGMLFVPSLITRIPWKKVAPTLGLTPDPDSPPDSLWLPMPPASPWIQGSLRGFRVKVFQHDKAIAIHVLDVDPGFTLRRQGAVSTMMGPDVETGDPAFDHRTLIEGDGEAVLALLDHSTRRAVDRLLEQRYDGVTHGTIRKRVFEFEEIRPALDSMLDLAESLRHPSRGKLSELLSQRALEDPSPGVRLRAFRRLEASHFRDDSWRETAVALRDSEDVPLRIAACRALLRESGPVGADAAKRLMDVVRQSPEQSQRREALEAVAGSDFCKDHVAEMAALLQDESASPVRRTAIEGLIEARALDELLQVKLGDDPDEAIDLAEGLGQIGDVRAQPRLFELLEHPRDRVRAEAAEALGDIGDVHAVERLRNLIDSGFLAKMTLGGAVESAIARIQHRLGGSQDGQISLVGVADLVGAISPAAGSPAGVQGGQISLTTHSADRSEREGLVAEGAVAERDEIDDG